MDFVTQNKINGRLHQLKRDGIQFISGTVSPAESDVDTNDIESLDKAIAYFAEKGVKLLVAQPKYMGSRCQVYLHRDGENFAVSRNGFRIRHVDLSDVYKDWNWILTRLSHRYGKEVTKIILDGELMPWKAIGSNLIEKEFFGLVKCFEAQDDFLKVNGFRDAFYNNETAFGSPEFSSYAFDQNEGLSSKALQEKYRRHETFKNLMDLHNAIDYDEAADMEKFKAQLDIFAKPGVVHYNAFDILRVDFADGSFLTGDAIGGLIPRWRIVSENYNELEEGIPFSPLTPEGITAAKEYFAKLVNFGYEGIMLKPACNTTDAVHCMKVRNHEYLRLIYGFDYTRQEKLTELVKKKRVGKKRKLSHTEHRLGMAMLALNPSDVDYAEKYDRIAKELLFEIEEESTLDGRL